MKLLVSLDINDEFITIVVCSREEVNSGIEILGVGQVKSEGIQNGEIINLYTVENKIKEVLKLAEESSHVEINVVNISTYGNHIKSNYYHGSSCINNFNKEIYKNDVKRLDNEMNKIFLQVNEQIIHIIPQSYCLDGTTNIDDPIGMIGSKLEGDYYIVTANTNSVNNIVKCINRCGVEINKITIAPINEYNALVSNMNKKYIIGYIKINEYNTIFSIFKKGKLNYSTLIPIGFKNIVNDIVNILEVSEYQAILLIKKFGNILYNDDMINHVISINYSNRYVSMYNLNGIIKSYIIKIIEEIKGHIFNAKISKLSQFNYFMINSLYEVENIDKFFQAQLHTNITAPKICEQYGINFNNLDYSYAAALGACFNDDDIQENSDFKNTNDQENNGFMKKIFLKFKKNFME